VTQLKAALLTADDLPTGYTEKKNAADTNDYGHLCDKAKVSRIEPARKVSVLFSKGGFGPFIVEGLGAFRSEARASESLAAARAEAGVCKTFTNMDRNGNPEPGSVLALSFPTLGDESAAFKVEKATQELPLSENVVMIRRGAVVVTVVTIGIAGADSKVAKLEPLARKALERIDQAR
jgi:hypothetical protein